MPPYRALADVLRERLENREWLPGEPMPSVAQLAAAYQVSTSTASRAIRLLADEGLVITVQGWGTFPAERPPE